MLHPLIRRLRQVNLITRFTVVGVLVSLVITTGAAWFAEAQATELLLAQVEARAVDHVKLGVLPRLSPGDFEPPFSPARLDDLGARLDPLLQRVREDGPGVLRAYLFARDGTILYSDAPGRRGEVGASQSALFEAALAGSNGRRVTSLSSPKNADLREQYGSALEVYVPVVLDGRVVGAYEVYEDLAPIRPVRLLVGGTALVGLVILLLALLVVVRGAAALIRRQQEVAAMAERERARLIDEIAKLETQQAVQRVQSEVIGIVSHEFRTPLSALVGFTELLLTREVADADRRQWLEIVHAEAQRLAHLVGDILDASRLEQGQVALDLQPVDLELAVGRVLTTLQPQATRHLLEQRYEKSLPPVLADPEKLAQILTNLISNAIKYSPGGGPVTISALNCSDMVRLCVADRGLGLPAEEVSRLFERFHRVDESRRRPIRGTGLGLYITKRLVDLHGGRIWAESPGPGKGSTFHVELPAARV